MKTINVELCDKCLFNYGDHCYITGTLFHRMAEDGFTEKEMKPEVNGFPEDCPLNKNGFNIRRTQK